MDYKYQNNYYDVRKHHNRYSYKIELAEFGRNRQAEKSQTAQTEKAQQELKNYFSF